MGLVKRFAERVSEEMGYGGKITGIVVREATKRLVVKSLYAGTLKCSDHESETLTVETFAGLFDGEPLCKKAWKKREQVLAELHSTSEQILCDVQLSA